MDYRPSKGLRYIGSIEIFNPDWERVNCFEDLVKNGVNRTPV